MSATPEERAVIMSARHVVEEFRACDGRGKRNEKALALGRALAYLEHAFKCFDAGTKLDIPPEEQAVMGEILGILDTARAAVPAPKLSGREALAQWANILEESTRNMHPGWDEFVGKIRKTMRRETENVQ